MKIFIIGSTAYKDKMRTHQGFLVELGHEVRRPIFDDDQLNMDELQICLGNIDNIKWAHEIHIFWDARSTGTIFDFGACVALGKKTKIIYINEKTFENVFMWYSDPKLYETERPRWKKLVATPFEPF